MKRVIPLLEIAIFTTGGTIDGADSDRGTIRQVSSAAGWLASQNDVNLTQYNLLNKDSRQLTAHDRQKIVQAVQNCAVDRVLITHGTFTISETGRALKSALGSTTKTVLLVGSWIPFNEPDSDAPQQMEYAFRVLDDGAPGVHIAMDGRLWDPNLTEKKEISSGKFQLVETRG
jgi:L-asparaginase